jgi:hypothetical protein
MDGHLLQLARHRRRCYAWPGPIRCGESVRAGADVARQGLRKAAGAVRAAVPGFSWPVSVDAGGGTVGEVARLTRSSARGSPARSARP